MRWFLLFVLLVFLVGCTSEVIEQDPETTSTKAAIGLEINKQCWMWDQTEKLLMPHSENNPTDKAVTIYYEGEWTTIPGFTCLDVDDCVDYWKGTIAGKEDSSKGEMYNQIMAGMVEEIERLAAEGWYVCSETQPTHVVREATAVRDPPCKECGSLFVGDMDALKYYDCSCDNIPEIGSLYLICLDETESVETLKFEFVGC